MARGGPSWFAFPRPGMVPASRFEADIQFGESLGLRVLLRPGIEVEQGVVPGERLPAVLPHGVGLDKQDCCSVG